MRLKLPQKDLFKKTPEATSDFIGNETADKFTRVSKTSQQN